MGWGGPFCSLACGTQYSMRPRHAFFDATLRRSGMVAAFSTTPSRCSVRSSFARARLAAVIVRSSCVVRLVFFMVPVYLKS